MFGGREQCRNESKRGQDLCYISTDPAENADNFDPKWASLREIKTDEEKYKAIRQRWGNADIPDPKVNLTYRHNNIQSQSEPEAKKDCFHPPANLKAELLLGNRNRRNKKVSRRRSRSCTRPYEERISNLKKNYKIEYSWLLHKQSRELEEIQIFQYMQTYCGSFNCDLKGMKNLEMQQKQDVFELLCNHYDEMKNFIGKKNDDIEVCKRYIQEVKSFFNLYQKVNDDTVTVYMTDEQYLHTIETEKMYRLYSKYYG